MGKLEDDMKALRNEFNDHKKEHATYRAEYLERQAHQDRLHEKNMEAIGDLAKATAPLVEAWITINGLQRFVKWLSGFTFIGALVGFFTWLATGG